MRQEDKLKEKYGQETGFQVPEGYFEELNSRILSNLPAYPEAPKRANLSAWQRVKPYLYLAAMFAGIWLMMNLFHRVSSSVGIFSLDNPPEALVQLIEDEGYETITDYLPDIDYELEREVSDNYDSFDEFETDFGYELSPEYSSLKIKVNNSHDSHSV